MQAPTGPIGPIATRVRANWTNRASRDGRARLVQQYLPALEAVLAKPFHRRRAKHGTHRRELLVVEQPVVRPEQSSLRLQHLVVEQIGGVSGGDVVSVQVEHPLEGGEDACKHLRAGFRAKRCRPKECGQKVQRQSYSDYELLLPGS